MEKQEILNLLNIGENREIEFKEAKNKLPKSIWETYSSMSNTKGGYIILGIKEHKGENSYTIEGVENVHNILTDFWNNINNKGKVSFNTLTDDDVEKIKIDEKEIIVIKIPKANRKNKPIFINGNPLTGTYKRYHEGDYKCSESEVKLMIIDGNDKSKDSVIFEEYDINDIDKETLKDYRMRFRIHKGENHKWNSLNDEDFLCLINGIDRKSKRLTLAGLLMFGKREDILYEFPSFFLDYREVEEISNPKLRWKNRITSIDDNIAGNIWSFFSKIENRLTADIEIPFALDSKMMRIENTPVHQSVREALANTLIHFQIGATSTIIVEKGEKYFRFANPGTMRISLEDAFKGGKSDPRNPILHLMFSQLGYGERAGTGLYNIKMVWQEKGWIEPEIKQDYYTNITTLILKMESKEKIAQKTAQEIAQERTKK